MPDPFYQCITDFIFVTSAPRQADVIFVPGGNYPDAALHAAALYHQGYAPYILPSGRYAKLTGAFRPEAGEVRPGTDEAQEKRYATEWAYLSDILLSHGVPEHAILKEERATFTWENAIFSRQVLAEKKIAVHTAILCCQAFHARRALMYYQEQFQAVTFCVCPVVTKGVGADNWYLTRRGTELVLGEVRRIGEQFHCVLPIASEAEDDR